MGGLNLDVTFKPKLHKGVCSRKEREQRLLALLQEMNDFWNSEADELDASSDSDSKIPNVGMRDRLYQLTLWREYAVTEQPDVDMDEIERVARCDANGVEVQTKDHKMITGPDGNPLGCKSCVSFAFCFSTGPFVIAAFVGEEGNLGEMATAANIAQHAIDIVYR